MPTRDTISQSAMNTTVATTPRQNLVLATAW
jgi:hypothetical protein